MNEQDFIKQYTLNSSQIMWFLGAGTSRTAGMPTAMDLIWDLKLKYYCREENQDIKSHDVTNEHIKSRIQSYMDSLGFPKLWSPEEYSFYFELTFGDNYSAQQKYLAEQLNTEKISLNIGHRALAGLVGLNRAKVIFTTNFDEVIETACAKVSGISIPTYHLEGSYAAIEALNSERFPIYAKIHGDFKYRSIKNLSQDLFDNDREIQKCFIASAARYGLIVTGYSGRDSNVMSMFEEAIEQNNAFSSGVFWTVPSLNKTEQNVVNFIERAKSKGIKAHIVETGTFDSMLSKIWRQQQGRTELIDKKVNAVTAGNVKIFMGATGNSFPVIRTNALPITFIPNQCAFVETTRDIQGSEIKDLLIKNHSRATVLRADKILAWGEASEITKSLEEQNIKAISIHTIEKPEELISNSTAYHAFYERALAIALCDKRPIKLKNDKGFILTMDAIDAANPLFQPLKDALANRDGRPGYITGSVPDSINVSWSEAVSIRLENRNNNFFLILRPMIWIEPNSERRNQREFAKAKRRFRYNQNASRILDAWIKILLGSIGPGEVEICCQNGSEYPALFKIITRTAFSRR